MDCVDKPVDVEPLSYVRQSRALGYQDQLASSTGWTVWVGGKQITGDFSKVVFQPHMVITIAYNSPNVKPDTVYNFAAGL